MSLSWLSVYVATPTTRDFPVQTLCSYLDTQQACLQYGVRIELAFFTGSLVHHARSLAVHRFLQTDDHGRIFWIDSDMEWTPVDFMRILMHSLKHECVVGLYPGRAEPARQFVKLPPEPVVNEYGLKKILGTGLGFACIQRGVMQLLSDLAPKLMFNGHHQPIPSIFRCDDDGVEARGEDYAFWADVTAAGYDIWADPEATIGHVGTKVFRCRT